MKLVSKKNLLVGMACSLMAGSHTASAAELAPYFYTWGYGNSNYQIKTLADAKAAGIKGITLAFGIAAGGCVLNADMAQMVNEPYLADIKGFIGSGGHVILSFGGANGTYLESQCQAPQMAAVIKNLMMKLGTSMLDFDVEGSQLPNTALNTVRNGAIVALQKEFPEAYISFTLPVLPTGLTEPGIELIRSAVNAKVKVSVINLMTMDYGTGFSAGKSMGSLTISALEATHKQLRTIFPEAEYSDARLWKMLGATPMIGNNDVQGEVFTLEDAKSLTTFAKGKNLGLLSYWALQRDQVGSGSLATHSGTNTANLQYYKIFSGVGGDGFINTPILASSSGSSSSSSSGSSSGSSSSSSGGSSSGGSSSGYIAPGAWNANGNGCRLWEEGQTFTVGDVVSYMGSTYTNIQAHTAWKEAGWHPVATPALWKKGGMCAPEDPSASSSGSSSSTASSSGGETTPQGKPCKEWKEGVEYKVGQVVAYQSINYTALRTYPNPVGANANPVVTPSVWQKGGLCGVPKSAYKKDITVPEPQPGSSSSSGGSSSGGSENQPVDTGGAKEIDKVHITWYACNAGAPCYPAFAKVNGYKVPYDFATEGDGSYANPISMAMNNARAGKPFPIGTMIYIPWLRKYAVLIDECPGCVRDQTPGSNLHIDLFQGALSGTDAGAHIDCANKMGNGSTNPSNPLAKIVIDPPKNLPVEKTRILSDSGQCTGKTF